MKIFLDSANLHSIKKYNDMGLIDGITTNVTLVFSANQAILAAKAGASYVSPFIGRLDDGGQDGTDLIKQIVQIFRNYNFNTEVLVASVRHPLHIIEAGKIGADIVTLPSDILARMIKHPLTDKGLAAFLEDWEKLKRENPNIGI